MSGDRASAARQDSEVVVAVCADPPSDRTLLKVATRIAVDLNLPFLAKSRLCGIEMLLIVTTRRLELRVVGGNKQIRGGRPIYVDAAKLDTTSPAGRRSSQPIVRAVGLKRLRTRMRRSARTHPLTVVDATAGWGSDTFLLAALGCQVLAVERHKIVAVLLRDGVLRAAARHPQVFQRIAPVSADAHLMLRRLAKSDRSVWPHLPPSIASFLEPDVVYLDPMFPRSTARHGAEPKRLRVLRRLVGNDADAESLFNVALSTAQQRVVVKRPLHAEPIADARPTVSHKGKSMRYDVYVVDR